MSASSADLARWLENKLSTYLVVIEISWFCVIGLYVARQKYAANIVCENLTTDLQKFDDLVTIICLLLVVGE